jgi:NAD(P)-dependent dehydrogenase (short-subunit alcohol dehydrogenase family)
MMSLRGRAALITGSTRGIGAAIAETYAAAGADIVLHGSRESSRPGDVIERIKDAGVECEYIAVDMNRDTAVVVDEFHDKALAAHDGIDILVHCAGGHQGEGDVLDVTMELFERTMKLHVNVPFFLTQRFARRWVEQGRDGRVLMIGSVNGLLCEQRSTAYDTSKAAMHMLARTMAVELASRRVRLNVLAPGLVFTDRTSWAAPGTKAGDWVRHHTPNGLVPPPDSCAGAALFLVSDEAYHVQGQTLFVDGGISLQQFPGPM